MKTYECVFGEMNDAMSFFEKYLTLHSTIGQTLLPSIDNPLNTHQLDTFVSRLLRSTTPSAVEEHKILHDWWKCQARPLFVAKRAELRVEQAKIREEAVVEKRRAEEAEKAAAPALVTPSPVVEIPESSGGNSVVPEFAEYKACLVAVLGARRLLARC